MKTCTKCRQQKLIAEFGKGDNGKPHPRCKRCLADMMKIYVEKNKEHLKQQAKARHAKNPHLATKWKLNVALKHYPKEQHAEIKADLDRNKCESCGGSNTGRRLEIDHDHITGIYRGVLCMNCNIALGHLKDDPSRILALRDYLIKVAFGI